MSAFVKLAAAAALAVGLSVGIAVASANAATVTTYGFFVLEDNRLIDLTGQLLVDVLDPGNKQVGFRFRNEGPLDSSIARIHFDDFYENLIAPPIQVGSSSPGVEFSQDATPPDLPGGENADPAAR